MQAGHGRHDRLGGRVDKAGWGRHRKAMYSKGGMQARRAKWVGRQAGQGKHTGRHGIQGGQGRHAWLGRYRRHGKGSRQRGRVRQTGT